MLETIRGFIDEHQTLLTWLAVGSGIMLLVSLATLPVLAVLLPADFLSRFDPDTPAKRSLQHPVLWWSARILKNTLGVLLLLAGLAMLVLPGQGLITMAFAVLLLDIPGKRRLQAKLLRWPRLTRPINKLRIKFGREALQ